MISPRTAWRDHMTGALWFIGGMLITTLLVGAVVIATRAGDTPAVTAERPGALTPVAVVRCPPRASPDTLISAAACGRTDVMRKLLARNADVEQTDPRAAFSGRTALHHAVQRGDEPQVQLLLAAGADTDARDAQGNTALHLLVLASDAEHPLYVARFLIEAGANIEIRNNDGHTPLGTLETDHLRMVEQQDLAQMLLRTQQAALETESPPLLKLVRKDDAPTETAPDTPEEALPPTRDISSAAGRAEAPPETAHAVIPPADTVSATAAEPPSEPAATVVVAPAPLAAPAAAATPPEPLSPEPAPADTPQATAVAFDTPPVGSPTPLRTPDVDIRARLDAWAKAWSDKDMATYFDAYAPDFAPRDGLSKLAWRTQREARIAGKRAAIEITLSDVKIERSGDTARIDFVQHYRAGGYVDVSRKRIEMMRQQGRWCISAEREAG